MAELFNSSFEEILFSFQDKSRSVLVFVSDDAFATTLLLILIKDDDFDEFKFVRGMNIFSRCFAATTTRGLLIIDGDEEEIMLMMMCQLSSGVVFQKSFSCSRRLVFLGFPRNVFCVEIKYLFFFFWRFRIKLPLPLSSDRQNVSVVFVLSFVRFLRRGCLDKTHEAKNSRERERESAKKKSRPRQRDRKKDRKTQKDTE